MAKIKLTKNEQKAQKDALKMYERYLPTLTLKKQQLQSEIRTIDEKAKSVRAEKQAVSDGFHIHKNRRWKKTSKNGYRSLAKKKLLNLEW